MKAMFKIYAIISERDGRIYVGFTQNLDRRIKEHNAGNVQSTQAFRPWRLFYTAEAFTRIEARTMEKKLKSGYGKEFLKALKIRG